eukprot:TRINITY_DN25627_c0_g1_i1.p1 TRINITY_DN25627_c0_g1~~TRINITY_DN25627_c0_g1_i1.p1  ORF type:complete len:102 (+),score=9.55 TRINITY_DN25627_c0_g1_i1:208-513(+)
MSSLWGLITNIRSDIFCTGECDARGAVVLVRSLWIRRCGGGLGSPGWPEATHVSLQKDFPYSALTVSYTHLTLPTKRIVEISVGAVKLKKKNKVDKILKKR